MTEKSIHQSKEEYVGELSDGKRHGHGLCIYPDGGQYEGEWVDDKRHGMGTYFDPNGGSFEGEWKDGMRNGLGCIEWSGPRRWCFCSLVLRRFCLLGL